MQKLIKFNKHHETHRETLFKFILLVAIVIIYFLYMSFKYGASDGFGVSILTWSFFILCTPVADGGFILAFPIRLLFKVKMAITQVFLWFFALLLNIFMLFKMNDIYDLTFLTQLLKHILSTPYPYWSILIISAIGTLLSILFGDEMMDVTIHKDREKHHKHAFKHQTIITVSLALLTILAYYYLIDSLNITIPKG